VLTAMSTAAAWHHGLNVLLYNLLLRAACAKLA